MQRFVSEALISEYEILVSDIGENPTREQIAASLARTGDWTDHGARVLTDLAQEWGTSMLRNALALASAMNIEDGRAGL